MSSSSTIRQLLSKAEGHLHGHDSPRLDAEVLLAHVLDTPRSHLFAWPDKTVEPAQVEAFQELVARRLKGEPVAHLTGQREFWSLPLTVSADTLIPRPDTETLVALALEKIPADASLEIADLGTGSGAIALAIASERPTCRVLGTDVSAAALAVARDNARRLGLDNTRWREGNWCEALQGERFHVLCANPPYVADADPHLQRGDLAFEPRSALTAGPQGLDELKILIRQSPRHLHAGGWLLLEHGWDQGVAVRALLREAGYAQIVTQRDAGGHERVSLACHSGT